MTPDHEASTEDRQYQAWGVLVRNSNLKSAHVANGLVQILRALPALAEAPLEWGDRDVPTRFDRAVRDSLRLLADGDRWKLGPAQVSLAVTNSTKYGPMSLTGEVQPAAGPRRRVVEAGLTHLSEVFSGDPPRLTRRQHELLEGALNADNTVKVSGAADPTTPGLCLGGYTSFHTLKPMHAATFLGALTRAGEPGRGVLGQLHSLVREDNDAHSRLVRQLGLNVDPPWPPLSPSSGLELALPFPSGDAWARFSSTAEKLTGRLLRWRTEGASKQEILMSTVDLIGLLLSLKMLGAAKVQARALLLVCATARSASARYTVEAARRTLRAAQYRLDADAEEQGLIIKRWAPSSAARTLALATGWLYPRHAQGGARLHLSPGTRQLVTLCQSLVEPDEGDGIDWWEFHERALDLGIVLGGADEARAAGYLGAAGSREALRRAGVVNQKALIELGLARHESDGVVRVTGGS